jgi:hypothetical protein
MFIVFLLSEYLIFCVVIGLCFWEVIHTNLLSLFPDGTHVFVLCLQVSFTLFRQIIFLVCTQLNSTILIAYWYWYRYPPSPIRTVHPHPGVSKWSIQLNLQYYIIHSQRFLCFYRFRSYNPPTSLRVRFLKPQRNFSTRSRYSLITFAGRYMCKTIQFNCRAVQFSFSYCDRYSINDSLLNYTSFISKAQLYDMILDAVWLDPLILFKLTRLQN